jgi:hypothetical protein
LVSPESIGSLAGRIDIGEDAASVGRNALQRQPVNRVDEKGLQLRPA